MISLPSLVLARNVLAGQQIPANAPDLIEVAVALKKAITEFDLAIAETTPEAGALGEVEIT